MAAQPSVDDSFTFVGGLYTEGSFFLTPKNSWTEGDNIIPRTDGSVVRRPGLDFEANHQVNSAVPTTDTNLNNDAFCTETWTSVGGNGNLDLFVVQRGPIIEFYKAFSGTVGANRLPTTIDLNTYRVFGGTSVVGTNVITTASCYGRLLITSIDTNPILVTYNPNTDTITHQALELTIRDFEGFRSPQPPWAEWTYEIWEQNYQFGDEALYNLYNQGWTFELVEAYKAANLGKLPANTKVWWYGKNADDNFDTAVLAKQDFGTSLAPRGKFLLNAFYQQRSAALASVPNTTVVPPVDVVPPQPGDNEYQPIIPIFPGGDLP